ncbi:MAG: HAMP domain-containing histidine kinase [Parcubacteria group bacterium]|nr:HAMP domain-containing histidine kinase [Parcubacteria group bacterium]
MHAQISSSQPPSRSISETISVVSHRLRTPLAVIKSTLEALLDGDRGPITPEQEEYLRDALTNVDRMAHLINHLIEISRIEQGELALNRANNDLGMLVRDVVQNLTVYAKASNITLTVLPSTETIPLAAFDKEKIYATVSNIISNAIRYSQGKGTVEISVQRIGDALQFSCTDSGIGINEEDQPKIFQKFFRSPRVMEMEVEGNGLGLYIDKAVVENHGGRIWFTTKPGKGSIFYFTLPIRNV